MKSRSVYFLFVFMLAGIAAVSFAAQKESTFKGEIMDSNCAAQGSHAAMTKGTNMSAAECTKACVGHGAKYVLYNSATKKSYSLSDQTKPAEFAGEKVDVTGTLNKADNTIQVNNIKAQS